MAAGVSHAWSWVKMGYAVRSCLVVFLYVLRAFSKINSKLEDDVSTAEGVLDIDLEAGDYVALVYEGLDVTTVERGARKVPEEADS